MSETLARFIVGAETAYVLFGYRFGAKLSASHPLLMALLHITARHHTLRCKPQQKAA